MNCYSHKIATTFVLRCFVAFIMDINMAWPQLELTTRDDVPYPHNIVNGIIFPSFISQKRVDDLKSLQLRSDDVYVATYAKSGRCPY